MNLLPPGQEKTMPQFYDCTCRLRLRGPDAEELKRLATELAHLTDERDDVLRALLADDPHEEHVALLLAAEDVASARRLAREIVRDVEQQLVLRFGLGAASAETLIIRETRVDANRRLRVVPDDGFGRRLVQGHAQLVRLSPVEAEAALAELGTAGPGGAPSHEDVLAKLDEWRVLATYEIEAVESHALRLRFTRLPQHLEAFAEDVLLFCPQVTDEVDALDDLHDADPAEVARVAVQGIADNLRGEPTLRLWWD